MTSGSSVVRAFGSLVAAPLETKFALLELAPRGAARILFLRGVLGARLEREDLRSLLRSLDGPAPVRRRPDDLEVKVLERLVHTLVARHRPMKTTCLFRALIRFSLLRRAGLPVCFVMGVRYEGRDMFGHAWLELDEAPFRERLEHAYRETFRYPEARLH